VTSAGPRTIRTIVFAFTREELPTSWLQVHRRFEHVIGKAGLKIRLRLEAIEDLPPEYDLLVVPPELRERAESLVTGGFLYVTTRQSAPEAADALLREIARGEVLTAEKTDPSAPKIVTHRGMDIV
jgi:hypothetical protein